MRTSILCLFLAFGLLLPAASDAQGRVVTYAAKSGEKYHKAGYRYVSKSQIKTTKNKVVMKGDVQKFMINLDKNLKKGIESVNLEKLELFYPDHMFIRPEIKEKIKASYAQSSAK